MARRLMERLEGLAEMIMRVIEQKKEEKRNMRYSPLAVSEQLQQ